MTSKRDAELDTITPAVQQAARETARSMWTYRVALPTLHINAHSAVEAGEKASEMLQMEHFHGAPLTVAVTNADGQTEWVGVKRVSR